MSEDLDEDYVVGYGRPPKHSQFKRGRSGNPKGRPKTVKKDFDVVAALDQEITINVNGKKMRVTEYEARYLNLAFAAINDGDVAKGIKFLKAAEKFGLFKSTRVRRTCAGGVAIVPHTWDMEEYSYMLQTYGPPPWVGEGDSGLIEREKRRLGYVAEE